MSISIRHAEPAAAGTGGERVALGLVLGVWFLAAAGAADAGWLIAAPGRPPLAVFAAIAVPVGLFSAAYALSRRFREYVRAGDPVLLTYIQAWRVIGLVFLVLMSFGLLPGAFAVPAGWGDVAVGVSAPFVARWLAVRGAGRIGWSGLCRGRWHGNRGAHRRRSRRRPDGHHGPIAAEPDPHVRGAGVLHSALGSDRTGPGVAAGRAARRRASGARKRRLAD